jgi:hypothetical protein
MAYYKVLFTVLLTSPLQRKGKDRDSVPHSTLCILHINQYIPYRDPSNAGAG